MQDMPDWMKKPLVIVVFLVSLAVLCLAISVVEAIFQGQLQHCPPSAPASATEITTQPSERIVFTTRCDRNSEIYIINADGSNLTNLTNDEVPPRNWLEVERPLWLNDDYPIWSPDGKQIAFLSDRMHTTYDIYVMDADGSNRTLLTNGTRGSDQLTWSPDGTRIAFSFYPDIFVFNTDGSNLTNLTNSAAHDDYPTWSPDGSHIVFRTFDDEEDGYFLSLINADGSDLTRLTDDSVHLSTPIWSWSPDSTHIAFSARSSPDYHDTDIYVVSIKDHNVTRLTEDRDQARNPAWSPDGTRIAFSASHTDGTSIFTIAPDGSHLTRLTDGREPAWSPDGPEPTSVSPTTSELKYG